MLLGWFQSFGINSPVAYAYGTSCGSSTFKGNITSFKYLAVHALDPFIISPGTNSFEVPGVQIGPGDTEVLVTQHILAPTIGDLNDVEHVVAKLEKDVHGVWVCLPHDPIFLGNPTDVVQAMKVCKEKY